MKEYIEREAAIQGILNDCCELVFYTKENAVDYLKLMPVADVAPVRHGRWMDAESDDGCIVWHCSVCSYPVKTIGGYPIYKYCPMCSAQMGKEDEHEVS